MVKFGHLNNKVNKKSSSNVACRVMIVIRSSMNTWANGRYRIPQELENVEVGSWKALQKLSFYDSRPFILATGTGMMSFLAVKGKSQGEALF